MIAGAAADRAFEQLVKLYPKSRCFGVDPNVSRATAYSRFASLKLTSPDLEDLLDHLEQQKKTRKWRDGFNPYLANFLRSYGHEIVEVRRKRRRCAVRTLIDPKVPASDVQGSAAAPDLLREEWERRFPGEPFPANTMKAAAMVGWIGRGRS